MNPRLSDTLKEQIDGFPGLPRTVTQLARLLDDPEVPIDRIETLLNMDPGMTANVLKLGNSAFFGFPARVGSVRKAVALLGARRLKQLVLASCTNSVMNRSIPGYDLPAGELWRHSIAVSVAAEGLTKSLSITGQSEIFTAALLHDIGKLVLGSFVKAELAEIESRAGLDTSFEAAERAVLGTDHAQVGALLLEKWAFPEILVHAVRWHHEPDRSETPETVTDIVHVANIICMMIGIGVGRDGLQHHISPQTLGRLGLDLRQIETVASQTLHWMMETAEALDTC